MRKIPTVFVRDWENDPSRVTRQPNPDCAWVFAGEGRATRKLDGTCTLLDAGGRWHGRREVKPGKTPPPSFALIQVDDRTGKRTGWQPIEDTPYAKIHAEALNSALYSDGHQFVPGTYELCGPKINRNPEGFETHVLIPHGAHDLGDIPLDFEHLAALLLALPYEGIVWHHPDGRMAKLKRRDVQHVEVSPGVYAALKDSRPLPGWNASGSLDNVDVHPGPRPSRASGTSGKASTARKASTPGRSRGWRQVSDPGIPEWFIGGPLDGKDQRAEEPTTEQRFAIAVPGPDGRPRVYTRRKFAIGRTVLKIWTVDGMREPDIGDRLAEILLAPHRDTEGAC